MFIERFAVGTEPTDAQILALEQIVIVEQDAPVAVAGVGQRAVVVGEVVNDHGQPNVPRLLDGKDELSSYYGGLPRWADAADGFEGMLYAALRPLSFPDLVVVVPDTAAVDGEGNPSLAQITGTCDDETTPRVLPAGTRLSNGGTSIWATLESLTFQGAYADVQTVRVRHVSGASTLDVGDLSTVVDTVGHLTAAVINLASLVAVSLDAAYETAIQTTLDLTSIAREASIIWACRHTAAVQTSLRENATEASRGGRGRMAVLSPPMGTTKTNATAGTGVGVAVSRDSRWGYAWPGWQYLLTEYSTTAYVTVCGDSGVACLMANLAQWEALDQETPFLKSYVAGEVVDGATYSRTFYTEMKAAGIMAPAVDSLGNRTVYSSVTTELSLENWKPVEQRRFADFVEDSLALYWTHTKGKLLSTTRREANVDAANDFLEGLAQQEHGVEPGNYLVADVSKPDDLEKGWQKVLVKVRRISALKDMIMYAQIGTTVQIAEAA